MRGLLEKMQGVAERNQCAFILIRHLNKKQGGSALDQGMGSTAIGAVARSVLRVELCEEVKRWRCLAVVACNLGKTAKTIRFTISDDDDAPRIVWLDEIDLDAQSMAGDQGSAGGRRAFRQAKETLRHELDKGPKKAKDCLKACKDVGVGERTTYEAMAALKIDSKREQDEEGNWCWKWYKPKEGWPADP